MLASVKAFLLDVYEGEDREKTKERTNKKTKEMLKEDRLTIGRARVRWIDLVVDQSCGESLWLCCKYFISFLQKKSFILCGCRHVDVDDDSWLQY